jgi:hypothetical protein
LATESTEKHGIFNKCVCLVHRARNDEAIVIDSRAS